MKAFEQSVGVRPGTREWYENRLEWVIRRYDFVDWRFKRMIAKKLDLVEATKDWPSPEHDEERMCWVLPEGGLLALTPENLRITGVWEQVLEKFIEIEIEGEIDLVEMLKPHWAAVW